MAVDGATPGPGIPWIIVAATASKSESLWCRRGRGCEDLQLLDSAKSWGQPDSTLLASHWLKEESWSLPLVDNSNWTPGQAISWAEFCVEALKGRVQW